MTVLADRLGADLAAEIIAKAGGTRISIPADIASSYNRSILETRFGAPVAAVLIFHFPGETIYVPKATADRMRVNDKAVAMMTSAKLSAREIALDLNCSERTVHKSRRRMREAIITV